jgi:hypothetical protein
MAAPAQRQQQQLHDHACLRGAALLGALRYSGYDGPSATAGGLVEVCPLGAAVDAARVQASDLTIGHLLRDPPLANTADAATMAEARSNGGGGDTGASAAPPLSPPPDTEAAVAASAVDWGLLDQWTLWGHGLCAALAADPTGTLAMRRYDVELLVGFLYGDADAARVLKRISRGSPAETLAMIAADGREQLEDVVHGFVTAHRDGAAPP